MTFPTHVSTTGTATNSPSTTHTVSIGTTASGDLLIALLFFNSDTTVTGPGDGWTRKIQSFGSPGTNEVWMKIGDGSDGTTQAWTTSSNQAGAFQVLRISGASGGIVEGADFDFEVAAEFTATTAPDPPSVTATWGSNDNLFIAWTGYGGDNAVMNAYPTNYSTNQTNTRSTNGGGGGGGMASASRQLASASDDPAAFTLASNEYGFVYTMVVRPLSDPATDVDAGAATASGEAFDALIFTGQQTPSNLMVEWDLDNDGDYDEAEEDVTSYVLDIDITTGRGAPYNRTGRNVPGKLTLTVDNTDNRFNYFNPASPLTTAPNSLKSGRLIRVRTVESNPVDPVLLMRDRFDGTGALTATEDIVGATGLSYTKVGTWTLGSGAVTSPNTTLATALVDIGVEDFYVQARMDWRKGVAGGLYYRYDDDENFGSAGLVALSGNIYHAETSAAFELAFGTTSRDLALRPTYIGVWCRGALVSVYLNGVLVSEQDEFHTSGGTQVGLWTLGQLQAPMSFYELYAWDTMPTETEGAIFTGKVKSVFPRVARGGRKTATVVAEGPLAKASAAAVDAPKAIGPEVNLSDGTTSGVMIGAVLGEAQLLHPPSSIEAGDFTLGGVGVSDAKALTLLRQFEETEFGSVFETPEGGVAYKGRASTIAGGPLRASFSDVPGSALNYETLDLLDWNGEIINRVTAGTSPTLPRVEQVYGSGVNVAAGSSSDLSITMPTSGEGGAAGDLVVIVIAPAMGYTTGPARLRGIWFTPPGFSDMRPTQTEVGRMRIYSKRLAAEDLGVEFQFYEDDGGSGGYGGSCLWYMFLIKNWYGDVGPGLAVATPTGYGGPTATTAQAGTNRPPVLFVPWGRAPTLFVAVRVGILSASGPSIAAESDNNAPIGYYSQFTSSSNGTITVQDIAIQTAFKDDIVDIEQPTAWRGTFSGYDNLETTVFAVRPYSGDPPERSGGPVVTVNDLDSQTEHDVRSHDAPGALFASEAEAETYGELVLARHAAERPVFRMGFTAVKDVPYRQIAYRTRVGDRIVLDATGGSGMGVVGSYNVETIHHRITDGKTNWFTEWALSPSFTAPPEPDDMDEEEEVEPGIVSFRMDNPPADFAWSDTPTLAEVEHGSGGTIYASGAGTTHVITDASEWTTAVAAAAPGDILLITDVITSVLTYRGAKYGLPSAAGASGTAGNPIIIACEGDGLIDVSSLTNSTAALNVTNADHVWCINVKTEGSQFGVYYRNCEGTSTHPLRVADCQITASGHAGLTFGGWFQLITASGGTPPSGSGNEWGFSQYILVERNTITAPGQDATEFGECLYLGMGGNGGWKSYAKNVVIRYNDLDQCTADWIDIKPGCSRVWVHDNILRRGAGHFGSGIQTLYMNASVDDRPSWADVDPEVYIEGNRLYDWNLSTVQATTSPYAIQVSMCGVTVANNILWGFDSTGTTVGVRFRSEKAQAQSRTTSGSEQLVIVNNLFWLDQGFDNVGCGVGGGFTGPVPSGWIDQRNNVGHTSTSGVEYTATSADFMDPAAIPTVGTIDADATWETYGVGSAFDLAPDSDLYEAGDSIGDVDLFIDEDISQRFIDTGSPSPGPFQPSD